MLDPRWRKMLRDIKLAPGRMLLMVTAIAIGVFALATMMASRDILDREIPRNYNATNPAHATMTVDGLDPALLASIRQLPGVAQAQASNTLRAAAQTTDDQRWLPLLLTVADDFQHLDIGRIAPQSGAWPPPPGTLLLEREALRRVGLKVGDSLSIRTREGSVHAMPIAGTVHDPSVPPASRGMTLYAYAPPASVAALGMDDQLPLLRLTFQPAALDAAAIDRRAAAVADWLKAQGRTVRRIQVPPPAEHPHQSITDAVLGVQVIFSGLTLVLGAVIIAAALNSMLARQAQQIGVMKALGASSGQVAAIYLALVSLLAIVATALGTVAGLSVGRSLANMVLRDFLNFSMASDAVNPVSLLALPAAGLLLPLAFGFLPVWRASSQAPLAALAGSGCGQSYYRSAAGWLGKLGRGTALAVRNTLRQRAQLAFTIALLGAAGAIFLATMNLRQASTDHLEQAAADRLHDIELVLDKPTPVQDVTRTLLALPQVTAVEPWPRAMAGRVGSHGYGIERVYPDGAHGSLAVAAGPDDTRMLRLAMASGRWLEPGERGTVVLNSFAQQMFPDLSVGKQVDVMVRGQRLSLRVVGIARQFMSGATLFVSPATFAALPADPGKVDAFRIILRSHAAPDLASAATQIEQALRAAGIAPRMAITETMMRREVDEHFDLLLATMQAFSALAALVGIVGMGASMSAALAGRAREFAIMRSIGGKPRQLLGFVLTEGMVGALFSLPFAILAALPLSAYLGAFLGDLLFGLPFPLSVNPAAMLGWAGFVLTGAAAACAWPAWRTARQNLRAALTAS